MRGVAGNPAMRNLSAPAREASNAQQTNEAFVVLVTINHSTFDAPVRVCSDPHELLPDAGVRGIISRGNEYIFMPFEVELPQQDDSGVARAKITMDNISREIVAAVRQATSALSITLEVVLASSPDTLEVSVADFRLERVTYDALTISGEISVEYFDLEPYPSRRFTPADFPGIF